MILILHHITIIYLHKVSKRLSGSPLRKWKHSQYQRIEAPSWEPQQQQYQHHEEQEPYGRRGHRNNRDYTWLARLPILLPQYPLLTGITDNLDKIIKPRIAAASIVSS